MYKDLTDEEIDSILYFDPPRNIVEVIRAAHKAGYGIGNEDGYAEGRENGYEEGYESASAAYDHDHP